MSNLMMLRKNAGFTLIELLIVIAIIGILSAIAIPMFLGQQTRAQMMEGQTNIKIIYTANENFYAENGRYAPVVDGTKKYKDPTTPLEAELRGLKFGNPGDLSFDYEATTCGTGQAFLIKATGKAGTRVEGMVLTLDHNNVEGGATGVCTPPA